MTVADLQQFLRSLGGPLAAARGRRRGAGPGRACRGLEPFGRRSVGLAELLARADAYERDGQLPAAGPALAGVVLDEPTPRHLADRLRTLLDREVSPGAPIPETVRAELEKLTKLKPAQVKELARELGRRGLVQGEPAGRPADRPHADGAGAEPEGPGGATGCRRPRPTRRPGPTNYGRHHPSNSRRSQPVAAVAAPAGPAGVGRGTRGDGDVPHQAAGGNENPRGLRLGGGPDAWQRPTRSRCWRG